MEVDDDFWKNLPDVTVWKKILVYSLRIILLPIYVILFIWDIIDYRIYLYKSNYQDHDLDDLTSEQELVKEREKKAIYIRKHPIINYFNYFYSHKYLYGY